MLVVFIAVNNPIIGLSEANTALAEPQRIETSAVSEANIAENITSVVTTPRVETTAEKAKIELAEYQKTIADENAQLAAEQAAQAEQARQEAAAKAASARVTSIVSHGGFETVYAQAEKVYGVPKQILAAIHMVETGQSGSTAETNASGAEGPMQFMPSTFSAYAQDGDGDGRALITDVYDSIYTAANYLAANGAANGDVTGALYRYNHSYSYVERVLSIAHSYGYAG